MKWLVNALLFNLFLSSAFADITIKNVEYKSLNKKQGKIIVSFEGAMKKFPELTVRDNFIQVLVPDSKVWPKIEKNVSLKSQLDTKLVAYQYTKDSVRVRAIADLNINKIKNRAHINVDESKIELIFPKYLNNSASKVVAKAAPKKITKKVVKVKKVDKKKLEDYDETYLDYLLEKKEKAPVAVAKKAPAQNKKVVAAKKVALAPKQKDEVSTKTSGLEKNEAVDAKTFSVMKYLGKYIAFLGLILVGLLGVFKAFKKGVLKKGKLGFLNNTEAVTVLSTTYIGPKSSLLLVKVHNQVMLLSKSESGVSFLSEIENPAGVLKTGELALSGTNFDSNLTNSENDNDILSKVKLKENPIPVVDSEEKLNMFLDRAAKEKVEEKIKLSDQVKKKFKGLKPLNQ